MGGIQQEVPTAPEEKQFSPTDQITEAHSVEKNTLADLTEQLSKDIRGAKTYQELRDAMHKGETAFSTIADAGLQEVIYKIEPTVEPVTESTPAAVTTGHEGAE
jgi:hypothetical protein